MTEKFNIKGFKNIFDLTGNKVGIQKKDKVIEWNCSPKQSYTDINEEFIFNFKDRVG